MGDPTPAGYGQKISFDEFETFKKNIDEIHRQLTGNVRQLQTLIGMVGSGTGWQGAAAAAFRTAQNSINNDHHAINQMLAGIIDATQATAKLGVGNDDEILQQFKHIDVNGSAAGGNIDPDSKLGGISAGLDGRLDGSNSNYNNVNAASKLGML